MGITKKETPEVKDIFATAKRTSMHAKRDSRHNLQRNIVHMFNEIDNR